MLMHLLGIVAECPTLPNHPLGARRVNELSSRFVQGLGLGAEIAILLGTNRCVEALTAQAYDY
jgi:hypothetical protein